MQSLQVASDVPRDAVSDLVQQLQARRSQPYSLYSISRRAEQCDRTLDAWLQRSAVADPAVLVDTADWQPLLVTNCAMDSSGSGAVEVPAAAGAVRKMASRRAFGQ